MRPASDASAPGYEIRDVNVRKLVGSMVLLAVGLALCFGIAALLYRKMDSAHRPAGPETTFRHGVVDESGIARDWRAQDDAVRQHLESYDWTDRQAGIVRIPIARAMELMVTETAPQPEKTP